MEREKEANKILENFKLGKITLDKARRELFVLCGVSKSASCKLDRLPKECSIFLYTSSKSCNGCGHYC
jgi:hypothetical protein